jgi:predicted kinase
MANNYFMIMSGLPRSGKSTWIKNNRTDKDIVLSSDEIRKKIFGHQYFSPADNFVFGILEGMAPILFKQGFNIIMDATNLSKQSIATWSRISKENNARLIVNSIQTYDDIALELFACLYRNMKSPKDEQVPHKALLRMATYSGIPLREYFVRDENIKWKTAYNIIDIDLSNAVESLLSAHIFKLPSGGLRSALDEYEILRIFENKYGEI